MRNQSKISAFSPSLRKPTRWERQGGERRLSFEPLEDRTLLAVLTGAATTVDDLEYSLLSERYDALGLPASMNETRLIEISADGGASDLAEAIRLAVASEADDLILVRTREDACTISLDGAPLSIALGENSGALTLVGLGDAPLQLAGSEAGLLQAVSGDIRIGGITLVGLTGLASENFTASELLTVADEAAVTTDRVFYLTDRSVSSASAFQTTGQYAVSEVQSGTLLSAEFCVSGNEWAYVTGLTSATAADYQYSITTAYDPAAELTFYDAEKASKKDDPPDDDPTDELLCWAGAASNMLYATGWANGTPRTDKAGLEYSFANEDDVMTYFREHFTDDGGDASLACEWFINGNYSPIWAGGGSGSELRTEGGGFYPNYTYDNLEEYFTYESGNAANSAIFSDVDELLQLGYGAAISIGWYDEISGAEAGGHAISLWGFTYDATKDASDPGYYQTLLISDPDDNKFGGASAPNTLQNYSVTWNNTTKMYQFDEYASEGTYGLVEDICCLAASKRA